MISRIVFDDDFRHAMRIRGLTLSDVARLTGFALATVSRAASGRPINMSTALRLARAVMARPVVPELEAWARDPASSRGTKDEVY
jgi:transcriptional regulator with XRE-family HTH domain